MRNSSAESTYSTQSWKTVLGFLRKGKLRSRLQKSTTGTTTWTAAD